MSSSSSSSFDFSTAYQELLLDLNQLKQFSSSSSSSCVKKEEEQKEQEFEILSHQFETRLLHFDRTARQVLVSSFSSQQQQEKLKQEDDEKGEYEKNQNNKKNSTTTACSALSSISILHNNKKENINNNNKRKINSNDDSAGNAQRALNAVHPFVVHYSQIREEMNKVNNKKTNSSATKKASNNNNKKEKEQVVEKEKPQTQEEEQKQVVSVKKEKEEEKEGENKNSSASSWKPPETFVRNTVKYLVREEHALAVKLFSLRHLPILEVGEIKTPAMAESLEKQNDMQIHNVVSSVYFDSTDIQCYHDRLLHEEGARLLRLRFYGGQTKQTAEQENEEQEKEEDEEENEEQEKASLPLHRQPNSIFPPKPTNREFEVCFFELKVHHEFEETGEHSNKERFPILLGFVDGFICGELSPEQVVVATLDFLASKEAEKKTAEKKKHEKEEEDEKQKQADRKKRETSLIQLATKIQKFILKTRAKPKVKTIYSRTQLQGSDSNDVRMTFDSPVFLLPDKSPVLPPIQKQLKQNQQNQQQQQPVSNRFSKFSGLSSSPSQSRGNNNSKKKVNNNNNNKEPIQQEKEGEEEKSLSSSSLPHLLHIVNQSPRPLMNALLAVPVAVSTSSASVSSKEHQQTQTPQKKNQQQEQQQFQTHTSRRRQQRHSRQVQQQQELEIQKQEESKKQQLQKPQQQQQVLFDYEQGFLPFAIAEVKLSPSATLSPPGWVQLLLSAGWLKRADRFSKYQLAVSSFLKERCAIIPPFQPLLKASLKENSTLSPQRVELMSVVLSECAKTLMIQQKQKDKEEEEEEESEMKIKEEQLQEEEDNKEIKKEAAPVPIFHPYPATITSTSFSPPPPSQNQPVFVLTKKNQTECDEIETRNNNQTGYFISFLFLLLEVYYLNFIRLPVILFFNFASLVFDTFFSEFFLLGSLRISF